MLLNNSNDKGSVVDIEDIDPTGGGQEEVRSDHIKK